jgi:hypothetical protein
LPEANKSKKTGPDLPLNRLVVFNEWQDQIHLTKIQYKPFYQYLRKHSPALKLATYLTYAASYP